MRRRTLIVAASLVLVAAAAALLPAGRALADSVQTVFVTNFPDVFRVDGTVAIRGPLPLASPAAKRNIVVPPVGPRETTRWIDAGVLDVRGFSNIVLSLAGQIKGESVKPGTVAAVLLPDEDLIVRAFEEKSQVQFQLEVQASVASTSSPYFASTQTRFQLGFPQYRVYLYNTGEKTVTASLYAYLTN